MGLRSVVSVAKRAVNKSRRLATKKVLQNSKKVQEAAENLRQTRIVAGKSTEASDRVRSTAKMVINKRRDRMRGGVLAGTAAVGALSAGSSKTYLNRMSTKKKK